MPGLALAVAIAGIAGIRKGAVKAMISRFRQKAAGGLRAGVTVDDNVVAVALVQRDANGVRLEHFAVSREAGSDWAQRTAQLTADLDMKRVPVSAVVAEDAYQLVLVECPQVPADEVTAAVRWKIKDLVAFPTDDAVNDTIDIPEQSNQSRRPMVYAVAAQTKSVQRQVSTISDAGLSLDAIDIPEMCLHNVAGCLPQAAAGVALLHFAEDYGTLVLSRAGMLYLIRRIDTGLGAIRDACSEELTAGDGVSDIALELQRSLDYFESHYDQRPITSVVLGPGVPAQFPAMLGEQLGLAVSALDLNDIVEASKPIPDELQPLVFVAVGAALRSQQVEAAA